MPSILDFFFYEKLDTISKNFFFYHQKNIFEGVADRDYRNRKKDNIVVLLESRFVENGVRAHQNI